MAETIGSRIGQMRIDMELSQPELAEKLEKLRIQYYPDLKPITRNDIANWEAPASAANKRTSIKASDVHLLSLVFGVDCDYIITGIKRSDKAIVADLGLSQKLIDELKEDQPFKEENKGWARVFNYLCRFNCYDLVDCLVDFLREDFTRNYHKETFNLIGRLIDEGKLDPEVLDPDYKNFLVGEAYVSDRMETESVRLKDTIKEENRRIHSEKVDKETITVIKKDGGSYQKEVKRTYRHPQLAISKEAREGGSDNGEGQKD